MGVLSGMTNAARSEFDGKTVLVTAGSKGIGFGCARGFMEGGASVAICARGEKGLAAAQAELAGIDVDRIFTMRGDISEPEFLNALVRGTAEHFGGGVDILVNNNGGPPAGATDELTDEDWLAAINGNLLSTIRATTLVLPAMKEKGWGRIINLTSATAREPAAGMALSNVTRAGVAAYGKTLSHEVGPYGITVNTILTGGCMTDRFYSLLQRRLDESGEDKEAVLEELRANVPVRFISTPDQFAHLILFLGSEQSAYLTGAAIPLDGGTSRSVF